MTVDVSSPAVADQQDDILDAIMARVKPVTEAKPNLKILLFSDPGGRKTSFAASAPNNLIIDSEDGMTSLFNSEAAKHVKWDSVQAIPFMSFYQVEQLIDRLNKNVPQLAQFDTITVDTLSTLHKKGLAEITEREWKNGAGVNKDGIRRNRYVPETDDHMENNEHIRRIVDALRDLNRNVIITTHLRMVQNKDKSFRFFPDFSEKLANTINGMMDVVAYVEQTKNGVVWHTVSDGYIQAKNRIGLPAQIENPTWETIYEYFQKHLENAKAQTAKA